MIAVYTILLILSILLSIFFSSADMAYGSASLTRLERIMNDNPRSKSKKRAYKLAKNYDKTISTILLFNDTVNAALDTIATLLGIAVAAEIFKIGDPNTQETIGFVFAMVSLVVKIIFGEIIAKSLGKIFNYKIADWYSLAITICYYITIPITFLVGGFGAVVTYPITKGVKDIVIQDDELHEMIDEAEEFGVVDEEKAELIRGTIDFASTETYEILTPRAKIFAVDKTRTLSSILSDNRTFSYSRIPVYEDNIDNIIGYVRSRDLIRLKLEGKSEDISSIIVNIPFFPRTTEINDILKYFKENKKHIGVVLDEYGGTEGIITREDILEELVGEIWDETDVPDEPLSERSDGTFVVDGGMNLEDFCNQFDLDFDAIETEYVTIGGFIIELLDDNFAKVGDKVDFQGVQIEVIAVGKHHTVKKMIVAPKNLLNKDKTKE